VTESVSFSTQSLVEATILSLAGCDGVQFDWSAGQCTFVFPNCTDEQVARATDEKTTVVAREFSSALRSLKGQMYASQPESMRKQPRRRRG
jgi:ABC-type transporter MlaC component